LCLVFAAAVCGCGRKDDTINVRMATLFGKGHHLAKKLEWMATELEARSGGRFHCQVFPGGTIGGEKENLQDLETGNLEVMNGAGSYYYIYVPEASVIELPIYEWKDKEEARRTIRNYWPRFVEVSQKKGYHPIALDIRDYWGIYYRTPIADLDAIRGAKFRAVNADLWIRLTELYGAVPNPIPYADAYMAFKTGVTDGSLGSVTGATAANWHEVLNCYLDTRLVLSHSFTLTSQKWLDNLPSDLRDLFLEVAEESEAFNVAAVEEQYEQNKQTMLDAGVTWIDNGDIDLSQLREDALAFREKYMKEMGPETYAFYQEWISHVEEQTGRSQGSRP
jgi:TRAP-type C4-dicarboxylate transport system substrate-binding protein